MAAEIGFNNATLGSIRLRLTSTASIASGIPCPLILETAVFGHYAHDESARHRNQNDPPSQVMPAHAAELR